MERIIKLIEDELDRKDEMIALRNWEIEELREKLKKAEEELETYRGKTAFEGALKANG